ncbi:guanylate kinase [Micromonospora sp. NPDC048830]|uniref:guanylate kinase n=1 Tax=Micromonospora sp. NPDC048830 TaxID=3364257 RepID=UPI00371C4099
MSTDDEARPAARLTVLSGPSGAGADRVAELFRARFPSAWTPVPATTRARRDGEVDGVDRCFLDSAEFDRLAAAGELLEWARIGPYRRGTPARPVWARLAAGHPAMLPLDLPGALALRAAWPRARLVLLAPPGWRPDPAVAAAADHLVTHDLTGQAVDELVGLLGSSFLAPAQPRPTG